MRHIHFGMNVTRIHYHRSAGQSTTSYATEMSKMIPNFSLAKDITRIRLSKHSHWRVFTGTTDMI